MRITTLDGSGAFDAYVAGDAGNAPAIIVLQEIFGVNPGIRAKVDQWAALGYIAAAPDLFWRIAPNMMLDPDQPEEFEQAYALMQRANLDNAAADIAATILAMRARAGGKVGVVGYCWGGLLAYLAATRTDSDASVGYYGVELHRHLREANAIARPLMLHVADRDEYVEPAARDAVVEALASNAHVTLHRYDAGHAFAREGGSRRVDAAADEADARTRAFFAEHLA